jgi:hypothetical protein
MKRDVVSCTSGIVADRIMQRCERIHADPMENVDEALVTADA